MPKVAAKHFFTRNLKFILVTLTLLILFYTFSFVFVKGGGLKQFDFNMTVRIQDRIPVKFDPYFSLLSLLGSFEATLIILVGFLLIFRRRIQSIFVVGMFLLMHAVELVGKAFLDHPPTPFMFHRYAFDFLFPTGYVQPGGSYPSGHAMRTTFLAVIFVDVIRKSKLSTTIKLLA